MAPEEFGYSAPAGSASKLFTNVISGVKNQQIFIRKKQIDDTS
jgi:hypothetical protein